MNDREVFTDNLNRLLREQGKMQKDLAEYVGAKKTTVSGWTRGVSYPRADAMEKIASFFGIPTSHLVGRIDEEIDRERMAIVVPDSERFVRLIHYMTQEEYIAVMHVFENADKRMREAEGDAQREKTTS